MRILSSAVFFLIGATAVTSGEPLRVMSFNIRYGAANDGDNHWKFRKGLVAEAIREFDPDVLGVQECLDFQSEFLRDQLPTYNYFGRSRMTTPNEHCGIFFKSERFIQLAGGHFWLSETPEVPASKSWDSSLPRMATWVMLQDKQNESQTMLMVNTHFDHRGSEARRRSAELLARRIPRLLTLAEEADVVVTGDFNCGEAFAPYQALLQGTLRDSFREHQDSINSEDAKSSENGTFNGWTGKTSGSRIDWILIGGSWSIDSAEIVRFRKEGRCPSDHDPVTAVLTND